MTSTDSLSGISRAAAQIREAFATEYARRSGGQRTTPPSSTINSGVTQAAQRALPTPPPEAPELAAALPPPPSSPITEPRVVSKITVDLLTQTAKDEFNKALKEIRNRMRTGLNAEQQVQLKNTKRNRVIAGTIAAIMLIATAILGVGLGVGFIPLAFLSIPILAGAVTIALAIFVSFSKVDLRQERNKFIQQNNAHNSHLQMREIAPLESRRAYWDKAEFLKLVGELDTPLKNLTSEHLIYTLFREQKRREGLKARYDLQEKEIADTTSILERNLPGDVNNIIVMNARDDVKAEIERMKRTSLSLTTHIRHCDRNIRQYKRSITTAAA